MNKELHEPLFHISKRGAVRWYVSWLIRCSAVVLALLVCALITMLMTGMVSKPLAYGDIVLACVFFAFAARAK